MCMEIIVSRDERQVKNACTQKNIAFLCGGYYFIRLFLCYIAICLQLKVHIFAQILRECHCRLDKKVQTITVFLYKVSININNIYIYYFMCD